MAKEYAAVEDYAWIIHITYKSQNVTKKLTYTELHPFLLIYKVRN